MQELVAQVKIPILPETQVNVRVLDLGHWLTRCKNIHGVSLQKGIFHVSRIWPRDTAAKHDDPLREIDIDLVAIRLSSGLLINEKREREGVVRQEAP